MSVSKSGHNYVPEIISICTTYSCNLNCRHCGQGDNKKHKNELTSEEIKSFLLQAKNLGAKRLNLTGGEIFVRPDALELIKYAQSLGFKTSIETNATLITEIVLKELLKLKNYFISVSLDGLDKDTHDFFRGVKGSFEKTMNVLRICSKLGIPFRATTTLNNKNISQIPQIYKTIAELRGKYRLLAFIQMYRKGVEARENYGVSRKELIEFLKKIFFPIMLKAKKETISLEIPLVLWPPKLGIDPGSLCPWGESLVGLSPDGTVGLCHVTGGEAKLTAGNIRENSLEEIWENSKFFREIRKFDVSKLKGICGNCLAKNVCRGGCRVHAFRYFRDLYAPNPDCQGIYEEGLFPKYALKDPNKYSGYEKIVV